MKLTLLRFAGVFLCIFAFTALGSAEAIRGTVMDSTGAVISKAMIQLVSDGKVISQTQTDAAGQFRFQVMETAAQTQNGLATYQIKVTADGFDHYSRDIRWEPSADLRLSLVLEVAPVLQSVDVNEKLADYQDRFDINEVRDSPARDLGEALTALDGVWKIRKAGIANDLVIRGFSRTTLM